MTLLLIGILLSVAIGIIFGIVFDELNFGLTIGSGCLIGFCLWLNIIQIESKQIPRDCQEIELKLKGIK